MSVERALPVRQWRTTMVTDAAETIQLTECPDLERVFVTTENSDYELIVLNGPTGEVLIRGGRIFPAFRRARLSGSSLRGSALMVNRIKVGLKMELQAEGKYFVTSTVQALAKNDAFCDSIPS